MCIDEEVQKNSTAAAHGLRVEVIDSWHTCWPTALADMERLGKRDALLIDHDGWLSARQCLLVAFGECAVAGHLIFQIQPSSEPSESSDRPAVEAHLDDLDVRPGFSDAEVRTLLLDAASRRARSLRCRRLVGF